MSHPTTPATGPERRRVRRHTAWFPVRFDGQARGASTALARNVSPQGVLLATRRSLEVGEPLTLHMLVDPESGRTRELTGRVVRMTRNDEDPGGLWPYKMAVEFEQPDPELVALVLAG